MLIEPDSLLSATKSTKQFNNSTSPSMVDIKLACQYITKAISRLRGEQLAKMERSDG